MIHRQKNYLVSWTANHLQSCIIFFASYVGLDAASGSFRVEMAGMFLVLNFQTKSAASFSTAASCLQLTLQQVLHFKKTKYSAVEGLFISVIENMEPNQANEHELIGRCFEPTRPLLAFMHVLVCSSSSEQS